MKIIMSKISTYLHFKNNSKEVFEYYSKVFETPILMMQTYNEVPVQGVTYSEEDGKLIMHARIKIGETTLMASDSPSFMGEAPKMCGFSISFEPDTREEADRVFMELAKGGNVSMPLSESSWNSYFGMLVDKFGVSWFVNVDNK